MKNTLLTLLSAAVNLCLGALAFLWAGILFLGLFTQFGAQIGALQAVLSLFLLALVVALLNSLFFRITKHPIKTYLLINVPMFLAGMIVFFLYSLLQSE